MLNKKTLLILTFLMTYTCFSQEEKKVESNKEKIHKIALVFGYTHIPSAFENGEERNSVFVPTIGVDYFVQFTKGWKIGAVFDLELNNYLVDFNRGELEREKALVTGVLVGYEFRNRWSFLIGPGIEFEKNKNLFVLRASLEYEFELSEEWGLFPSVNYDFKEEYSTWSINIGISKRL
jgi:hypothetical protein